jgi:hypothetical protein
MTIHISWEYFLGIVGVIIAIGIHSHGRFTVLETSMDWVKDTMGELKLAIDNINTKAFASHSPVNLTVAGENWLAESGLKQYLDTNKDELLKVCEEKKTTNPYEVQAHVFKYFDTMIFKDNFEDKLKKFAFEKGLTMETVRRIGAIYFRNMCLDQFGMKRDDIDKHDPAKPKTT